MKLWISLSEAFDWHDRFYRIKKSNKEMQLKNRNIRPKKKILEWIQMSTVESQMD